MRKHTRIYLDFFGYGEEDFLPCEICGRRATEVHHIKARGMGGSKNLDHISNLMAVDRECHIKFGDKKQYMDFLRDTHEEFMKRSKFA